MVPSGGRPKSPAGARPSLRLHLGEDPTDFHRRTSEMRERWSCRSVVEPTLHQSGHPWPPGPRSRRCVVGRPVARLAKPRVVVATARSALGTPPGPRTPAPMQRFVKSRYVGKMAARRILIVRQTPPRRSADIGLTERRWANLVMGSSPSGDRIPVVSPSMLAHQRTRSLALSRPPGCSRRTITPLVGVIAQKGGPELGELVARHKGMANFACTPC